MLACLQQYLDQSTAGHLHRAASTAVVPTLLLSASLICTRQIEYDQGMVRVRQQVHFNINAMVRKYHGVCFIKMLMLIADL